MLNKEKIERQKRPKYTLTILLQILCLFAPEFILFPKYTWILALIGILMLFSSTIKKVQLFDSTMYKLFGCIVFNIILSLTAIIFNGSFDFSYIVYLIGTTLSIFRTFFLIYMIQKFKGKENTFIYYIEIYIYSCTVYVIFTILFIIFPNFKTFWLNNVVYSTGVDYYAYEFRYSLNGFAAFSSATVFSIAVLFNAYLIVQFYSKPQKLKRFFLNYIILIVGCFFYGRITIVAIVFSAFYIFFSLAKRVQIFKIIIWSITIICFLLSILSILAKKNSSFAYWRTWAFAIINQLFSGNGITDYSVTHMFKDMYYIPDIKTLIFGDGQYTVSNGGYYGGTDVGFMRAILFFGIFGCLVNYAMFFMYWWKCKRLFVNSNIERFFIYLLGIILVVLEMKGEAYHQLLIAIIPLYYCIRYEKNKLIVKEDKKFYD